MSLLKRIFKRVAVYTILLIATVSFLYTSARLIPGDPITVLYGESAEDYEARKAIEQKLGLDKPLHLQLLTHIGSLFSGNWGRSIYTGESVTSIVLKGFKASLKLALLSTVAVILTTLSLLYIEFVRDLKSRVIQMITPVFGSMPTVVWGATILLLLTWLRQPVVGSIVPPLIVLTIVGVGLMYKIFRSTMEYSYRQPFVEVYTMMGYSRGYIFLRVLGYSTPAILSAVMYRAGLIIAGAIVVEAMFMYPGMGFVFYTALSSRDYPVLVGWGVAVSIALILINLAVDIIHELVDPRVIQQ